MVPQQFLIIIYAIAIINVSSGSIGAEKCTGPEKDLTAEELENRCKKTTESPVCEGRGICNCGSCVCYQRPNPAFFISGSFCDCDNYNCPRHNRRICSGHGACVCKKCQCNEGWSGQACECPESTQTCVATNGKVCNDRGSCACGVCKCEDRYSGRTCEICPTCPANGCLDIKPCVQCQVFRSGPYESQASCEISCNKNRIMSVDAVPDKATVLHCEFVDSDNCTAEFGYEIESSRGKRNVFVREIKVCPPTPKIQGSAAAKNYSGFVVVVLAFVFFVD